MRCRDVSADVCSSDRDNGYWRMVGGTQHHDRATLGQRDDQTGRPGHAMGMNDDRLNIVERYPHLFLTIKAGDQTSAISGKMAIIRGDINKTIKIGRATRRARCVNEMKSRRSPL